MQDSAILGTGNSRYLKSVSNFMSLYPTYADFVAALVAGTLPIDLNGINAAGWTQIGTALAKANLLSDATAAALAAAIGMATPETVNEALAGLAVIPVKIITGSYTGTGIYGSTNPNSLTFGFSPKLVIVYENAAIFSPTTFSSAFGGWKGGFIWVPGMSGTYTGPSGTTAVTSLSGNTLSWYSTAADRQLNVSGTKYNYVAIG